MLAITPSVPSPAAFQSRFPSDGSLGVRTAREIAAAITPTLANMRKYLEGNVLRYGADPTGVADSTAAFVAAASISKEIYAPAGAYSLTGLTLASERTLRGDGYKTVLNFSGPIALIDVRKVCIRDCLINLTADDTTLLELGTDGGVGTFECYFSNVVFSGTTSLSNTIGVSFDLSYINTFVNCHFIWFDTCAIQFNTEANRNVFLGCTIRSSLTYGTVLVESTAGVANSFVNCDLENCNSILDISGGFVTFGDGCYFEAHNAAFGFELTGGHASFEGCYFNEVFFRLGSGGSIELSHNWIKGSSLSNANSPLIRVLSGFSRLILQDNVQQGVTYLLRADPTLFNYLQIHDDVSAWSTAYPGSEHIYVRDTVYDVTNAARTYVEFDNVRERRSRSQNYIEGRQRFDAGSNGVALVASAWNYSQLRFGAHYLWPNLAGAGARLYYRDNAAPTGATDGFPLALKVAVPGTATTAGQPGDWAADTSNFYVYTGDGSTHTWRRVAVAAW